jgi:release factor glutamine methyltransferase
VAIALKHEAPGLEVWASDISTEALEVAQANAERLLGPPPGVRFIHSDLFARIPGRVHLITAKPPDVGSVEIETLAIEVRQEPRLALDGGADGRSLLLRIIARAPEHLAPGGILFLEADPRQMTVLYKELEIQGFKGLQTYKDLSGAERIISGYI